MSFISKTSFEYVIHNRHWEQVLKAKQEYSRFEDGTRINVRVHNYPESMIALKNLKAAYIGNAILS